MNTAKSRVFEILGMCSSYVFAWDIPSNYTYTHSTFCIMILAGRFFIVEKMNAIHCIFYTAILYFLLV